MSGVAFNSRRPYPTSRDAIALTVAVRRSGKLQPPQVQKPGADHNEPDSDPFWRKFAVAGQRS